MSPNPSPRLSSEDNGTASSLDLLLSELGDEAGLDDEGLGNAALAEELEGAGVGEVNHGDGTSGGLNLGVGKGDELGLDMILFLDSELCRIRRTLSTLMVGRT
jgi:hypothetical protein